VDWDWEIGGGGPWMLAELFGYFYYSPKTDQSINWLSFFVMSNADTVFWYGYTLEIKNLQNDEFMSQFGSFSNKY
jgi:hypothetical protein